jgi:hypothetical protein
MIGARDIAVYNSPIAEMPISSPVCPSRACSVLLAICCCLTSSSYATDWTTPAQDLARKIAAARVPGSVAVNLVNRSSLSKGDVDQISRDLQMQLETAGVRTVKPEQATTNVEVSLSENLQSYVWVAEIHRGTADFSVAMVAVPRPITGRIVGESVPMNIRKTLLWSQEERILDLVVLEESSSPLRLAVLSSEDIALYRLGNGTWQQEQVFPIAHSKPWPRDMRGRLILRQGRSLDAYLPGVLCKSSPGTPMSFACLDVEDPWPLSTQFALGGFFTPTRNFFTRVLAPGVGKQITILKFYSAAPIVIPGQTSPWWMFAMIDGTVHLLDGSTEQTQKPNWGSDLAGTKTSCGSGWQILVSGPGGNVGDSIRAYEVADRVPVPVSETVDFAGTVTALWSDDKGTAAIAVSRNAQTGIYEAFRLAVACGQ